MPNTPAAELLRRRFLPYIADLQDTQCEKTVGVEGIHCVRGGKVLLGSE